MKQVYGKGGKYSPVRVELGCRFKANYPLVGPWPTVVVPSKEIFLRNPNPYLSEFRRKPRKTSNNFVDKRDCGLNLASPIYQLLSAEPLHHWWGIFEKEHMPLLIEKKYAANK